MWQEAELHKVAAGFQPLRLNLLQIQLHKPSDLIKQ